MARFSFSKINRFHKRTGLVFLGLACLAILLAVVLTYWATMSFDTIAKNGLTNVTVGTTGTNVGLLGSGIDLAANPSTNLLKDPSFEPYVFREVFTVEDGDKKTMVVSNKQVRPGVYGTGFFVGADVRVMTNDKNGITLRKTGKVVRYAPNQIGEFQKSPIIGDIPTNARLNDYTTKENVTITVGQKGIIIKGINTQSPTLENADTSADLTSVTNNGSKFFACTADGLVISSIDGVSWEKWSTPAGVALNAIAASQTAVVAVGDQGAILTGFGGILYIKEVGLDENITDIAFGNNLFVAVTDKGNILYSSNGILWNIRPSPSAASYRKIVFDDTLFALMTKDGAAQIFTDILKDPVMKSAALSGVLDITIMSKSKILLLTANDKIYQSGDMGDTWEESKIIPPKSVTLLGAIGDEEILAASLVTDSHISRLVTEIEMDSDLRQGTYQAGDLCYLDIEYAVLPDTFLDQTAAESMKSEWEFYGDGEARKIMQEGAPYSGVGIMKLSSYVDSVSALPYAAISQPVSDETPGLAPSTFYTFDMWVRQDKITDGTVKVWISGPFKSIGIEFSSIGTTWKKVTFKFLVPPEITSTQAAQARINIGTSGPGIFYFDKTYLGLTSENEETVPLEYRTRIQAIAPSLIRLDFLSLGARTQMPNRWAHNGKLEEAFEMVQSAGDAANPWIVIDSHMGESELRNLIEYIAGSISTIYGRYRMENGSTLPWSGQFDKILIEFDDTVNIFASDVTKAVYVNEQIRIIESSPYYKNIKNNIIFIDGMQYTEGLMLSTADHSASDFKCTLTENRYESITQAISEYSTVIPRNADRPSNLPINLMRTTAFENPTLHPNSAELITVLLDQLGVSVDASMVSLEPWSKKTWSKVNERAAMIAGKVGKGELLPVTKTQIGTNISLLSCYAYKDNNITSLVFASHNPKPVAISVDIPFTLKGATLIRVDANGEIVENGILKSADKRFNILPGNVILIQIPAS